MKPEDIPKILSYSYYKWRYIFNGELGDIIKNEKYRKGIVDEFNKKNVILCISAGRVGTMTLARYLSLMPDTYVAHEPNPQYRFLLREIQKRPRLASKFLLHVKVPYILLREENNYVETSHLLCKGFFESYVALGFRPTYMFIVRDLRKIALSLLRKTAVPGRTPAGMGYLLCPNDHVYVKLSDWKNLTDYQLCYWYTLEMQYRQYLYKEVCERYGIKYIFVKTEEFNDVGKMAELASGCQLLGKDVAEDIFLSVAGEVFNESQKNDLTIDFEGEEKKLMSRIEGYSSVDDVLQRIGKARMHGFA